MYIYIYVYIRTKGMKKVYLSSSWTCQFLLAKVRMEKMCLQAYVLANAPVNTNNVRNQQGGS